MIFRIETAAKSKNRSVRSRVCTFAAIAAVLVSLSLTLGRANGEPPTIKSDTPVNSDSQMDKAVREGDENSPEGGIAGGTGNRSNGPRPCWASSVHHPRMVVFGDSLTDTGNHLALFGTPPPPFFQGRYSNGPVWIEYLRNNLGLPASEVANYAVGGATSGRDNAGNHPEAPGMLDEFDSYLADLPCFGPIQQESLFVIWIGANDFEVGRQALEHGTILPQEIVAAAMQNIRTIIGELADRGAKRFLVGNLPDLGQIPLTELFHPDQAELATIGTVGFNDNLMWLMAELESERQIDVTVVDVFSLFLGARTCPACFGLENVTAPCLDLETQAICTAPESYLFWDLLHPTTATHNIIATQAAQSLLNGGMALPQTPCISDQPGVKLTAPNGLFTTSPTIRVVGEILGQATPHDQLLINGAEVSWSPDGHFSIDVPLDATHVETPVVAELRRDSKVLDRDRLVIVHGASIAEGETAHNALLTCVNANAIPAIRDEVIYQLTANNSLDLWPLIPDMPIGYIPIDNFCDVGYDLWKTYLNYSCPTADVEFHQGYVRLRFDLHDINLGVGFHGWLDDCPDPGLDCSGNLYIPHLGAQIDVSVRPRNGGSPGEVEVTPVSQLLVDPIYPFVSVDDCNPDFLGLVEGVMENFAQGFVGPALQDAVSEFLEGTEDEIFLAQTLEEIIAAISISGPLGEELGLSIEGDIQSIQQQTNRLAVWFETAFSSNQPSNQRTYAVPKEAIQHTSLDPVAGEPYSVAASVSLESLNQLLLANTNTVFEAIELTELDLGTGPIPITAGLLSLLVPSLTSEAPEIPFVLRIRPTMPPMLTGERSENCGGGARLFVGQVVMEFVSMEQDREETQLAIAFDLDGCANFDFNAASGSLVFSTEFSAESVSGATVTENRVCANEPAILLIASTLVTSMIADAAGASYEFPLSDLNGLDFEATQIVVRGGYVSLYFQLSTAHGRPDLIVEEIVMPNAIDRLFSFNVPFKVKNIGTKPADWGAFFGASLSIDSGYANGNDIGLAQQFYDLHSNPILPGHSRWYSLNCPAIPWAMEANQTLFVMADVPASFGGAGAVCESDEGNNHAGVTILTTTADAYVAWISPPDNLIGGIGPRPYQVRVGRNNVGIDEMLVPVHVQIGNPPLTWGDVMVTVPRGEEVTTTVFVPTPGSFGECGASNFFPIGACATLAVDSNRNNDCAGNSVEVAVPYWDLAYEVNGPSFAHVGDTVNTSVTVCNNGIINSMQVCSRSCIGLSAGDNYTDCINGSLRLFTVPSLAPNQCTEFNFSSVITPGAANDQFIKAGVDYFSGCFDNCSAGNSDAQPISVCGADLRVSDIILPSNIVGGVGPRTYQVVVQNYGCDPSGSVQLTTCLAGNCGTVTVQGIAAGSQRTVPVNLLTPPAFGPNGQITNFDITACVNNWFDTNAADNCRTESVPVAAPYWDLRFEPINVPNSGRRCHTIDWDVRVRNMGNVSSPHVCAITGITATNGCGNGYNHWNNNLGLIDFQTPNILPGGEWTYHVDNYFINCGAWLGTQWVKVEINYSADCFDQYSAGNCDQESISITP